MLYNRIGNFHFELKNFDEALKAYKKGLRIERKVLGKSHPNIIVTLSNIGEILRQKGMHSKAIRLYTDVIIKGDDLVRIVLRLLAHSTLLDLSTTKWEIQQWQLTSFRKY
mmetsp:Transcript_65852/g.73475  ORF Transcript_65852/g.73475 Transcript_65852/m.73475 type:complete len:110 (-) Transcript_65852:3546-3875(-)